MTSNIRRKIIIDYHYYSNIRILYPRSNGEAPRIVLDKLLLRSFRFFSMSGLPKNFDFSYSGRCSLGIYGRGL